MLEQSAPNGDGGHTDVLMGDVLRTREQQVSLLAKHRIETPFVRA